MLDDIGGQNGCGNQVTGAPVWQGVSLTAPLAFKVAWLREMQRQRRFCIVSQSRSDRACEAFVARYLGYRKSLPEAERDAIWERAAAMRKSVEKGGRTRADDRQYTAAPAGGEGQVLGEDLSGTALSACTPIILNSAVARRAWDNHRKQTQAQMEALARSLPVWPWVKSVAGFDARGLAIIVGEAGDLTDYGKDDRENGYGTHQRLWKRLGLAVIEGERQRRVSGIEAAAAHGYDALRRAEMWVLADSMFRWQWGGAKEDRPAGAKGPYGEVYGRRKAHTATRDWKPKHRDADARRIMWKALIEDLWRVWNGKAPLYGVPGPRDTIDG